jgi:hypothetical protein
VAVLALDGPVNRTDDESAQWCNVGDIAAGFPLFVVRHVLADEVARGRVELDGERVRIIREAFTPAVLAALAALD